MKYALSTMRGTQTHCREPTYMARENRYVVGHYTVWFPTFGFQQCVSGLWLVCVHGHGRATHRQGTHAMCHPEKLDRLGHNDRI